MDQSHGNGIGGWDPNSFASEAWDHQFGNSGLAFDQGAGAQSSYPNPDFLDGNAINPQLPGADSQAALYRPFDFYGQGDVWSDHSQAAAAPFAQEPSLRQAYFGEQRHSADTNQTIDSRFAQDIQQGNEFPSQLHSNANQQVNSHHGFGHGVANGPNNAPNGYSQDSIPQWQEQIPGGYGSGHQFENPLSAAQASGISVPASNGSPSPFFPGHGAGARSSIPGYQTELHQQVPVNARQIHPQFAAPLNGQPQQPVPIASSPRVSIQSPARKATPQQFPQQGHQHVAQQAVPQQQPVQLSAQRQVQQPAQQPVQQSVQPVQQSVQPAQQPAPRPALQPGPGQHVFSQQPISHPQPAQRSQQPAANNVVAGIKRSPTSETQVAPAVAKKAKVLVPAAASSPSPSAQAQFQNVLDPICTINYQDASLLSAAQGRPGARWKGVPNLVIGSDPVKLQKGTPTKRYVTLSTKGGKDPLFSKTWRAWTPAESLGNHADAYQKAQSDLDRQRADLRLEIEMKRGLSEIPVDWWKKGLKDRLGKEATRPDPPAEPVYTDIKVVESLRLHPAHLRNQKVTVDACADFAAFLNAKAGELKTALQAASGKTPGGGQAAVKARTAKEQLERAITEGLRVEPGNLFAKLSGSNKLITILNNILIKLINAGEANSSLAKTILRLYTRFTKVTSEQLKQLQMEKLRGGVGKAGDAEAKALIAQVFENAKQNDDDASESESDSAGAEPGARGKKATSAQTRVLSAQTATGSDSKKTTASSTLKSATSTADSRKLSSASISSKTMAANADPNKAFPKTSQKLPSTTTGTKRSREDDAAGADVRSSKKPATDAPSAGNLKTSSMGVKPPAVKSTTASSGSVAAQAKPRSTLLLPGKARPATKPAVKPEPAKAEAQKSAAKPDAIAKVQPTKALPTTTATTAATTKTTKPKPAEAVPSTKSIFSSLMKEIDEEKRIKTPSTNKQKESSLDPNETPEERERRLRKEKRRSLRVAFRSGDALVEIREFTRHPEEIAEWNMARNVRTDGRDKNSEESEMMKRLHGGQGIKAVEINDREWEEPTAVQFAANIPQEKREETYITRGGFKTFETDEQKLTRERELNELMVIYHNRADIPPSPRSPPYEPSLSGSSAANETHLSPAAPEYDEMVQRGRECRQWGSYHAARAAQGRLETKARPDYADFTKTMQSINSIADSYNGQAPPRQPDVRPPQPSIKPSAQPGGPDPRAWYEPTVAARRDQQTFELLSSDRAKNWQDPDPHNHTLPPKKSQHELANEAKLQQALNGISFIVESLRTNGVEKPTQATSVPQPAQQEVPQPGTVAAQGAQAASLDYSAAWAQYYATQQQQQQQQAWYSQQQNPYTQAANPYLQAQAPQAVQQQQQTTDPSNQYASILAALGIQQPTAQPQSHPTVDQNSQIQAALMALAAGGQGQAAAPSPADPQSAQYLLDMMKLAGNQNQGQPQGQPAQNSYQQYYNQGVQDYNSSRPERDGYSQGYGQSHQEREAYVQVHGAGQERERERERERDGYGRDRERDRADRDYHRGAKGRNNNNNGKNENIPEHLRGINRSLIGTKACAFWAKGQCAKGDKCTFRHD